jgi:hypothetical protein
LNRLVKAVVIAVPALTLVSGIGLMEVMNQNHISSRQFNAGFAYYAGLHPSFQKTPFVVGLAPMWALEAGETEEVECSEINCPIGKMEEITRKHFGSNLDLPETRDKNGELTEEYLNQAVSWKKEMSQAVWENLPGVYMNYVPVNVWFDHRGQPALRILIWLTIFGAVGSLVVMLFWFVMKAKYYRSGEAPDVEGRNSGNVTSIGSLLK